MWQMFLIEAGNNLPVYINNGKGRLVKHILKKIFSSPCLKRRIETTGSPLCSPGLTVRVGVLQWGGRVAPACQEETSVCRSLPAKAVSLNSEKGCVVPRLWEPAWGDSCPGHCGHRKAWQSEVQPDLANPLGSRC